MLCCFADSTIVECSVCGKSSGKTVNQLSIEESKAWYVKRGDPIYCRKCLVAEKIRLKQELETLKAINVMKNRKKDSKMALSLRTIKDGKAWKKSESFVSAYKPSQKAIDLTKRAEKRAQNKQEIQQSRKETFSYDLRKELEVRRKLSKLEKGEREQNLNLEDIMSSDADGDQMKKKSRRGRRRSSIVEFFKKFTKSTAKRKSSITVDSNSLDPYGDEENKEEEHIITPVGSNQTTPRHSFDHTYVSTSAANTGSSAHEDNLSSSGDDSYTNIQAVDTISIPEDEVLDNSDIETRSRSRSSDYMDNNSYEYDESISKVGGSRI